MPPVIAVAGVIAGSLGVSTLAVVIGGITVAASILLLPKLLSPNVPSSDAQASRQRVQRSPNAPHEWVYGETIKSGVLDFYDETGTDREYAHVVILLAPHQVESIGDVYFNDKLSTEYDPTRFRITRYLGTDTQLADPDLVAESSRWTTAHRLQGIAYVYVRFQYAPEVWPNGIPNIKVQMQGKNDIFDPRDSSTGYTTNPVLCARDYLLSPYGAGATELELNSAGFIAGANICDEQVTTTTGNTENRFTLNGVISTETSISNNLQAIASAMGGSIANTLTGYTPLAGVYQGAPTFTLTQDDLTGAVKFRTRTPRRDLFNTVNGQFIDPDSGYLPVDFPQVNDANFLADDDGEEIVNDIDLPLTTSPYMAQRLAKLFLARNRNGLVVDLPVKLRGLNLCIGQNCAVTLDELGWDAKEFRVIDFKYDTTKGVTLSLKEESASLYAYVDGELPAYTPPARSNLPLVGTVPAVTALDVDSINVTSVTGVVRTAAEVSWTAPAFAFVSHYEVQWGQLNVFQSLLTTETQLNVLDVTEDETYDFRVRAFSKWGSPSPWVSVNQLISGKLVAPDAVASLSGEPFPVAIELTWPYTFTGNEDLDYFQVAEATTNARGTANFFEVPSPQLNFRRTFKTVQTRYYWIRPVDTSGNLGDWFPLSSSAGVEVTTQSGGTGTPGADGLNGLQVEIFQRTDSSTAPALPSVNATINFNSGIVTGLNNGWQQAIPSTGGQYLWRTYTNATGPANNATATISPGNWFAAGINSTDGDDGSSSGGALNRGRATDNLRLWFSNTDQSTELTAPIEVVSDTALTFSTGFQLANDVSASRNDLYSERIPIISNTKYRVSTYAQQVAGDRNSYLTVIFYDSSGSIISSGTSSDAVGWRAIGNPGHYFGVSNENFASTRTLYAIEFGGDSPVTIPTGATDMAIGALLGAGGTTSTTVVLDDFGLFVLPKDGNDGESGFTPVVLRAYKRSTTEPTDNPGAGTYTVATDSWTPLNGWSLKPPSGEEQDPVWEETLRFSTNQATFAYAAGSWEGSEIYINPASKSYGVNVVNPNPTTPANSDGTGYDLSLLVGRFQVLENGSEINGQATFSVVAPATKNGLTAVIDADGDITYTGTSWSSNGEVFNFQALYDGITFSAGQSVTKVLSGAPGGSPPVQVQVSAVGDFQASPTTASAGYSLTSGGQEQTNEGGNLTVIGDWLVAGAAGDYECELTVNSGTAPSGSAVSSRLSMSSTRTWTITDSSGGLPVTNNVTIRLYNATTNALLASRTFTMSAEQGI